MREVGFGIGRNRNYKTLGVKFEEGIGAGCRKKFGRHVTDPWDTTLLDLPSANSVAPP